MMRYWKSFSPSNKNLAFLCPLPSSFLTVINFLFFNKKKFKFKKENWSSNITHKLKRLMNVWKKAWKKKREKIIFISGCLATFLLHFFFWQRIRQKTTIRQTAIVNRRRRCFFVVFAVVVDSVSEILVCMQFRLIMLKMEPTIAENDMRRLKNSRRTKKRKVFGVTPRRRRKNVEVNGKN